MIDKLEYLIALARERHFGRAATVCGVTQPTLSSGIKQLEEMLGVLLVDRGSRFHGLTAEGERTLEWARRIVADARAMQADLRGTPSQLSGRLRLGVVPSALPAVVALTTPYRARHPEVTFSVLSRTSNEILEMLDNLQIDAGITYLDGEGTGRVRTLPLHQERYCLAIAAAAAPAFGASASWAEVGGVPLCLLTPDMQNRRIIEARLREAGTAGVTTLESNSMITLMSHVRTGQWASVLPMGMAEAFGLPASIRLIPIHETGPMPTIGLVYPQRDPIAPLTAALLDVAALAMSPSQ
jgi:DNA-binding transcriptional LysR family regulator